MRIINPLSCEADDPIELLRVRMFDLTERLGASVIGATVFELRAGERIGPYHYHHGVEEWFYTLAGAPLLRRPDGERALEPGELVAFSADPAGAHTTHGPGRVLMFSAGARGWGEAFISVYPDSDKIAAAPGVMFRRADAIETWHGDAAEGIFDPEPSTREEWAMVVRGTPTLRRADGETMLSDGDICCFPQGPTGAHRLRNDSTEPARLVVFSTSTERPASTFYPDDGTVLISLSNRQRLLFRHDDRIEDYWDGEREHDRSG